MQNQQLPRNEARYYRSMKSLLKLTANFLARLLMLPLALTYWCLALCCGKQRTFPGFSQFVSLCPGHSGIYLRRAFYQWVLPACGEDACLSFGTVISHPTARIGRSVYVGVYCILGDVTLEDDVLLGSHVSIINGNRQHGIERLEVPVREQPGQWPRVTVGCDTWIGERAVIQADLGRHCVIGAGAVVTQPIPDYGIAVGVPAKVVRFRNAAELPRDPSQDQSSEESTQPAETSP
jgi:virginiamycin A acetyltransferase